MFLHNQPNSKDAVKDKPYRVVLAKLFHSTKHYNRDKILARLFEHVTSVAELKLHAVGGFHSIARTKEVWLVVRDGEDYVVCLMFDNYHEWICGRAVFATLEEAVTVALNCYISDLEDTLAANSWNKYFLSRKQVQEELHWLYCIKIKNENETQLEAKNKQYKQQKRPKQPPHCN